MEADVPGLEIVPRVWADAKGGGSQPGRWGGVTPSRLSPEAEEELREAVRVTLAPRGDAASMMSTGEIVAIVEDKRLNDPVHRHTDPDGD
ncbi:unnamed protein product, partial [Ectocarpus sp. 12 AP-2014]